MNKIDDEEFLNWINDVSPPKTFDDAFILVTGLHCPNCDKLKNKLEEIRHPNFGEYCFTGKNKETIEVLKKLEVSETPSFIIKEIVQYKNFFKVFTIKWVPEKDQYDFLENIFDALNQKDTKFFNYDEYGRTLSNSDPESETNYLFYRLIRTVFGEVDVSSYELRKEFEDAISSIGTVEVREELTKEKGDISG